MGGKERVTKLKIEEVEHQLLPPLSLSLSFCLCVCLCFSHCHRQMMGPTTRKERESAKIGNRKGGGDNSGLCISPTVPDTSLQARNYCKN